jgi:hypothetical protein
MAVTSFDIVNRSFTPLDRASTRYTRTMRMLACALAR